MERNITYRSDSICGNSHSYLSRRAFLAWSFVTWLASAHPVYARASQRIVSTAPSLTEMLFGVGALKQIVAVSDYCTYPPEVKSLPHIGGWLSPNIEKIVSFRPDLVVLTGAQSQVLEDRLRQWGLPTLTLPCRTIAEIYKGIEDIGAASGHVDAGVALARETRNGLEKIAKGSSSKSRPSVLLVLDRPPGPLRDIYVATAGGYMTELVEVAGGRYPLPPVKSGFAVKLSLEQLMICNPDYIFDISRQKITDRSSGLSVWSAIPELQAVKNKRVVPLDEEYIVHPSQFIVKTAGRFWEILHGDSRV